MKYVTVRLRTRIHLLALQDMWQLMNKHNILMKMKSPPKSLDQYQSHFCWFAGERQDVDVRWKQKKTAYLLMWNLTIANYNFKAFIVIKCNAYMISRFRVLRLFLWSLALWKLCWTSIHCAYFEWLVRG